MLQDDAGKWRKQPVEAERLPKPAWTLARRRAGVHGGSRRAWRVQPRRHEGRERRACRCRRRQRRGGIMDGEGVADQLAGVLGERPLVVTPSATPDHFHAWFRAKPGDRTAAREWACGGLGGEIRGNTGWIALWDPQRLLQAIEAGFDAARPADLSRLPKPPRDKQKRQSRKQRRQSKPPNLQPVMQLPSARPRKSPRRESILNACAASCSTQWPRNARRE